MKKINDFLAKNKTYAIDLVRKNSDLVHLFIFQSEIKDEDYSYKLYDFGLANLQILKLVEVKNHNKRKTVIDCFIMSMNNYINSGDAIREKTKKVIKKILDDIIYRSSFSKLFTDRISNFYKVNIKTAKDFIENDKIMCDLIFNDFIHYMYNYYNNINTLLEEKFTIEMYDILIKYLDEFIDIQNEYNIIFKK